MEQKIPVIGVTPLWDGDKNSLWMVPGYLNGLREVGALPIILPLTTSREELMQFAKMCDGFLFTGGHDLLPNMYREVAIPEKVICCPKRDVMEYTLLQIAIDENIPLLGICRGLQFINVFFGGTLYQDLPTQHPSEIVHRMQHPYDGVAHSVKIVENTPLYTLLNCNEIEVNSLHHQAIKDLAPHLTPMAYSHDGLIEAVSFSNHKFMWGVQWHPEFSYTCDNNSRLIFKEFVKNCLG